MTTAEMIRISTSLASETAMNVARIGRLLRDVLFFSLADDRIAPKRRLLVLPESGGVVVVFRSRFLSRMKTRRTLRYPFDTGRYPTPEGLASTVALAANALKAAGAADYAYRPEGLDHRKDSRIPPRRQGYSRRRDRLRTGPAHPAFSGEGLLRLQDTCGG